MNLYKVAKVKYEDAIRRNIAAIQAKNEDILLIKVQFYMFMANLLNLKLF